MALLKMTIRKELGDGGRLEYQILMNNGHDNRRSKAVAKEAGYTNGHGNGTPYEPGGIDTQVIKNPFVIPGIKKLKIDPQLNTALTFETFIEGDCNRLARSAGVAVAKKPGGTAFNPLVIFGDVGLGKTHLAHAIGNEVVRKFPNKSILYVSSEKFTNQIIESIKNNAVNDFVNFYQLVDVLIVDDIQFLANKLKTQEIFFHIFNQLHQNGKQVVLTSDRPPKDLEGMEERLISRFKWGLSADLQAPDLETRIAILESKMTREGLEIPQDVSEFICYNIKNNIRELEGVLVPLMPDLVEDFFDNPSSSLATIKCYPWQVNGKTLLVGDSAHAVVPFYGQGMNASFEDCHELDKYIEAYGTDWKRVFENYQKFRKKDADAIGDLAEENYFEMRAHVADPVFVLKRQLETTLEQTYPGYFSKYSMVTFREDIPYSVAMKKGRAQDDLLMKICSEVDSVDELDMEDVLRQLQRV